MDNNEGGENEQGASSKPPALATKLTLEKAVELGEYDPNFLANFPEWHTLSRHIQFQYVKKALENRNRQLLGQYAELNNVLDLRNKPEIWDAIRNMEKQLHELLDIKEKLFAEYSAG
jgi:hypothetical protein